MSGQHARLAHKAVEEFKAKLALLRLCSPARLSAGLHVSMIQRRHSRRRSIGRVEVLSGAARI